MHVASSHNTVSCFAFQFPSAFLNQNTYVWIFPWLSPSYPTPRHPPTPTPPLCFIIAPFSWLFNPLVHVSRHHFWVCILSSPLHTGWSWVKERSLPPFSCKTVAAGGQMLSYPVGTKYNSSYKPGQTCNNEPWSRLTKASVSYQKHLQGLLCFKCDS